LPDPQGPNALPEPPPDPKVVVETMKLQQKDKEFQSELQFKILDLQQEAQYLSAEITEKESRAMLNVAQAEGIEAGHQVAALQQSVALMKQKQEGLLKTMKLLQDLQKLHLEERKLKNDSDQGGVSTTPNK